MILHKMGLIFEINNKFCSDNFLLKRPSSTHSNPPNFHQILARLSLYTFSVNLESKLANFPFL